MVQQRQKWENNIKIDIKKLNVCGLDARVRWVPCQHGMARPQVADTEDGLQIWRVAENILNKQSRAADKGWCSSFGVGHGANNSP
jgi:hypothetical protein